MSPIKSGGDRVSAEDAQGLRSEWPPWIGPAWVAAGCDSVLPLIYCGTAVCLAKIWD